MNAPETSTMAGSHVEIKPLDGVSAVEFSELLVHIMGSAAGVVTDPDAEIFDFERFTLVDLKKI